MRDSKSLSDGRRLPVKGTLFRHSKQVEADDRIFKVVITQQPRNEIHFRGWNYLLSQLKCGSCGDVGCHLCMS